MDNSQNCLHGCVCVKDFIIPLGWILFTRHGLLTRIQYYPMFEVRTKTHCMVIVPLFSSLYNISYTDSWQCTWLELIWPRGVSRGIIWAQAVYMSPYTLSRICITILSYCRLLSLRQSFFVLHFYLELGIIYKCRETIRWRRPFINNGYEEKTKHK